MDEFDNIIAREFPEFVDEEIPASVVAALSVDSVAGGLLSKLPDVPGFYEAVRLLAAARLQERGLELTDEEWRVECAAVMTSVFVAITKAMLVAEQELYGG